MKKFELPVAGFLIAFVIGWLISVRSPIANETITFSSISRDPAAIRRVFDFSSLQGDELNLASKKRMISGAHILYEAQQIGIELGHFVVKSKEGGKEFACQRFSKLTLAFSAEGMAVNGEKPTMEVEGNCTVSNDINSISPIWIPMKKIVSEPVVDGEFDFRNENFVQVKFQNVSDSWPKSWVLKSVKLSNDSEESLYIDEKELKDLADQPILLNLISE